MKQATLSEYGCGLVERHLTELSLYAAKQDRLIFAYEDAAVSFANVEPFNPRCVEVFRRKMEAGKPWGFYIGGKGCPQQLRGKDRENVAYALGQSFPSDVLPAAAETAAKIETSAAAEKEIGDMLMIAAILQAENGPQQEETAKK